jgi:hypothetical protein
MAQPLLNVTELDADQIKANMKAYFTRQDSPIKDWNFEGSGLNMLLDVLAYNTHYNAILAHLNLNESFIDTAQLRSSVISQAKLLGYIPTSITAATAKVSASFVSSKSLTAGSDITIKIGSKFTGTSPNGSFTFVNTQDTKAIATSSNSGYTCNLNLIQGILRSQTYQVDNSYAGQKFVIDDPSADISTLKVLVYDTVDNTNYSVFIPITTYISSGFNDLANVNSESQIYYLSLNSQGKYEIKFGDGVLGKALNSLNIVKLTYYSTEGPLANGITDFQFADSATDTNNNVPIDKVNVTLISESSGGKNPESTESIRLNAPASLITQRRAVTANDYITLLRDNYDAIGDGGVNVWGGEDEVPFDPINAAQYAGKVFISFVNDSIDKNDALSFLKKYKVMSVTPQIIAKDTIKVALNVNFRYDPNLTSKSASELITDVENTINAYNNTSLNSFTGIFRHSNLLTNIDNTNPAILNSDIQVSFYKTYSINPLTANLDVVDKGIASIPNGLVTSFGNKLFGSVDQANSMVSSSGFYLNTASMGVIMPSQKSVIMTATWSANTTSMTILSSPGTSTSSSVGYNLTNAYLVRNAVVTSSVAGYTTSPISISSINNTGTVSVITLTGNISTTATASAEVYVTPPDGTYYVKDADDPLSTTSRRLFMSPNVATVPVSDPKFSSTGTDIHIGTLYPDTGKLEMYRYITGAAASSGNTTTDIKVASIKRDDGTNTSSINFLTNQFKNCVIYITGGVNYQQKKVISSNSTDTITVESAFPSACDNSSQFMIIRSCIDITSASTIDIFSRPASNDISPNRQQLLNIVSKNVTGTIDIGVIGNTSYTTFPRDPS